MSDFHVKLSSRKKVIDQDLLAIGNIKINDFEEDFYASLSYWNINDYIAHWQKSLIRLVDKKKNTCLITSMYNPKQANYIFWWILYLNKTKDLVYIQNHILFLNELKSEFSEKNIYQYIPQRETTTDDGEKISEWIVGINDIKDFIKKNVPDLDKQVPNAPDSSQTPFDISGTKSNPQFGG